MNTHRQHDSVRRRPRAALMEGLENRLLCKIVANGEFVIAPPGGGAGHETIHMQPEEGLIGLRSARENSGGPHGTVVNWQITSTHEWNPGEPGGPGADPSGAT